MMINIINIFVHFYAKQTEKENLFLDRKNPNITFLYDFVLF